MSNTLYRAGNAYTIPAVPYQPARAAYTWSETLVGTRVVQASSGWIRVPITEYKDGPIIGYTLVYTGPGTGTINQSYTYVVQHYVPAVPEVLGSPAMRVDNPSAGWTSFAHTVASAFSFCEATFKVRDTVVGAAVGLSSFVNPTAGYGHIPHGLLFTNGQIKNLRTGALLGTYVAADTFAIRNYGGTVTFYKNGASIGSESSTYGQETLRLSTVLYSTDDFVSDPTLVAMGAGNAAMQLPALQMLGGVAGVSNAAMTLPAMTMKSQPFSRAEMVLPAMSMLGSESLIYAQGAVELPALTLASYGGALTVTPRNLGAMSLPAMAGQGLVLVGQTGSAALKLPAMTMLGADRRYAGGAMVLPAMAMSGYDEPADLGLLFELLELRFDLVARAEDLSAMPWPLLATFDLSAEVATVALMPWPAVMDFGLMATTEETALLPWGVLFDFALSAPAEDVDVWAVNVATSGSTSYAGFVFNSFANIGGRYYGSNAVGIFELDGDDDAGVPIDAAISLGAKDFGSAQKKTLVECFVTMAGSAPLAMKLRAEGSEFVYQTQSYSDELQLQRFKFGKGKALQANYLTPIIYNIDGEDFELEGIEFAVADLQRKL